MRTSRRYCRHLNQAWDDRDFLRCADCRVRLGRAYPQVEATTPQGEPYLVVVFDARYAGGSMAAGTVIDYREATVA